MSELFNLINGPAEAFKKLKDTRNWIYMLIVICLFTSILGMISLPHSKDMIKKNFEKREELIRDKLGDEQYEEMLREALLIDKSKVIITGISGFFNFLIMALLAAVLCYLVSIPFGLPGEYFDYFKIISYASISTLVSVVLKIILVPIIGDASFSFSLTFFLPEMITDTLVGSVLTLVNPFYIWYLVLIYLGCVYALDAEKKKAKIVVSIYVVFVALMKMAFFYLGSLF